MGRHRATGEDDDEGIRIAVPVGAAFGAVAGDHAGGALAAAGPGGAKGVDDGGAAFGRRAVAEDEEDEHPGRALLARLLAEAAERTAAREAAQAAVQVAQNVDASGAVAEPQAVQMVQNIQAPGIVEASQAVEASGAVAEPQAVEEAPTAAAAAPPRRRESGTSADLRLLRQDARLRLRCALAALAPFVVFTGVLLGLRRADVYLIWVWIPTVLAGVFVGALLDRAHRRREEAGRLSPPR